MKSVFLFAITLLLGSGVWAADITPNTLVGRYNIEAKAFNKSAKIRLTVIDAKQFEVQRLYDDHAGKICNGTYQLKEESNWGEGGFGTNRIFKGLFSCPDDRSKTADFDINFKTLTTRDLEKGAYVEVTSSLASGMTLNAKMKKE